MLIGISGALLRRDWPVLRRRLPYLALMGVVGLTVFNALFYLAAHETTAVNIGILQGAMPVLVLLCESRRQSGPRNRSDCLTVAE
jgi:drug/metabolite transporter (DMT)-like permease